MRGLGAFLFFLRYVHVLGSPGRSARGREARPRDIGSSAPRPDPSCGADGVVLVAMDGTEQLDRDIENHRTTVRLQGLQPGIKPKDVVTFLMGGWWKSFAGRLAIVSRPSCGVCYSTCAESCVESIVRSSITSALLQLAFDVPFCKNMSRFPRRFCVTVSPSNHFR